MARFLKIGWVWLALAGLLGLTGCEGRNEGLALAGSGQKAAAALAMMYEQLAQDTVDTMESQAFLGSLRQIPLSAEDIRLLEGRISALNRRARMAARLGDAYSSLGKLAAYNAVGGVGGAAEQLIGAVRIPDIPSPDGRTIPVGAIGNRIAGEIAGWQQVSKLKDASRLLSKTVGGIHEIFGKETLVYQSISQERKLLSGSLISELLKARLVLPYPLLDRIPESLGLSWADPRRLPDTIEPMMSGFAQIAAARFERRQIASEASIDASAMMLSGLLAAHAEFEAGKPLDLAAVLGSIEQARSELAKWKALRGEDKDAEKK